MFIFKSNQRRANIFSPYTAPDGTRYTSIPRDLLDEIPDPVPPADYSDETYYRTEQDDAPYVIYTQKSPQQLKQVRNAKRKQRIQNIEDRQSLRAIREALLTGDLTKLQAIEADVVAVRGELEQEDA